MNGGRREGGLMMSSKVWSNINRPAASTLCHLNSYRYPALRMYLSTYYTTRHGGWRAEDYDLVGTPPHSSSCLPARLTALLIACLLVARCWSKNANGNRGSIVNLWKDKCHQSIISGTQKELTSWLTGWLAVAKANLG